MARKKRQTRSLIIGDCSGSFRINWLKACFGEISEAIENELIAFMVSKGDKFSLFKNLSKPKSWLLMIWDVTVYNCNSLKLISSNNFQCTQENQTTQVLNYPESQMKCMDHPTVHWEGMKQTCAFKAANPANQTTVIFATDDFIKERSWTNGQISASSSILLIILMLAVIWLGIIIRSR